MALRLHTLLLCLEIRRRREKPGDDGSGVIQIDRKPISSRIRPIPV